MRSRLLVAVMSVLGLVAGAAAQQPPPVEPAPLPELPPPPPAVGEPAPGAVAPPPPSAPDAPPEEPTAAAKECVPGCRAGFVCQDGQCVSACNPPCPAGQQCTAEAVCEVDPGVPPPRFFGGPEAPPPKSRAGVEQHDGLMLRFMFGFGSAGSSASGTELDLDREIEHSGFSVSFSADVGGAPEENLILHGRLAMMAITRPQQTIDGVEQPEDDVTVDAVDALLLGPALSYYFMPANIYVTAAAGLSWLAFPDEEDDESDATQGGIGFNVDVGKEWWVSYDWGLGVAARFWYTRLHDENDGLALDHDFLGWGILFSATYQ